MGEGLEAAPSMRHYSKKDSEESEEDGAPISLFSCRRDGTITSNVGNTGESADAYRDDHPYVYREGQHRIADRSSAGGIPTYPSRNVDSRGGRQLAGRHGGHRGGKNGCLPERFSHYGK